MQRRVVADDAGAEAGEQLRDRARRRRHADEADGGAAELTADRRAVGAAHRYPPQQRQHRADDEFGLGAGTGREAADDLDLAPLTGREIDVLRACRDPADGTQHRCEIERFGVDRQRRRHDGCPDVIKCAAELARQGSELRCVADPVPGAEPLHDIGVEAVDDEQVHGDRFPSPAARDVACKIEMNFLSRL
jgi:hypothetical protein